MTGRLADLFRLAWGLFYWNARKSWFRFRRGRVSCPCQSPSDSGRAMETTCEASLHWHRQANFRRVCPLLVSTPDGLRCSVDTADVRPFWSRTFRYYGGTLAALYLAGTLSVFVFLRIVGYPISIVHLVWPGSWHRVGEVRGWFFLERSNRAFAAGRPAEGMLYLVNAYEFSPSDYTVGFLLAQKLQLNNPLRSDAIYQRLLREHPVQRTVTAQVWFRALLARGDFPGVEHLAAAELLDDPTDAAVWLRAFLFANRQTRATAPLEALLNSKASAAARWRPLLVVEAALRTGQTATALAELKRPWPQAPAYSLFYQIAELTTHGEALFAVDLLGGYQNRLDDTARTTLSLEAYATLHAERTRQILVTALLAPPFNLPTITLLAAHLIRHPNQDLLDQVFEKFTGEKPPVSDATLETYLALYCASGAGGDWGKLHTLAAEVRRDGARGGNTTTLALAEAFFRGQTPQTRIAGLLAALPMALEVDYALLDRYPGQSQRPAKPLAP